MASAETLFLKPASELDLVPLDRLLDRTLDAIPPLELPALSEARAARLPAWSDPEGLGAEQYRRLAIELLHLRARRPLQKILITSAAPAEGKSLCAANLALTLARANASGGSSRVLLLEGDLHRPALLKRMGVRHPTGLADWLERRAALAQCLARWPDLPLWLLPAARVSRIPLELLHARLPEQILASFAPHFGWIILDAPPLLPMADAMHWARAADGVVLVVREHRTRRSDLLKAARQIEPEKWLGLVLNHCSVPEHRYYSQYYLLR